MTLFLDAVFFWVGLVAVVATVLVFLVAILVAVRDGHRRRRLEDRMDDFLDGVLGDRAPDAVEVSWGEVDDSQYRMWIRDRRA